MPDLFELEAKYQADEATCRRLQEIERLGEFKLESSRLIHQIDTYYDTRDLELRRQSASIRIRRIGEHTYLTYKGSKRSLSADGHIVMRREEEIQLDGGQFEGWTPSRTKDFNQLPAPAQLIQEQVPIGRLAPIATVDTRRNERIFADAGGQTVDLAIDQTTGKRHLDDREIAFNEVEVEAIQVGEAAFATLLECLERRAPGLKPGGPSKLARTLE